MANKEKMGPPTLEMIQGNPYNYTFMVLAKDRDLAMLTMIKNTAQLIH